MTTPTAAPTPLPDHAADPAGYVRAVTGLLGDRDPLEVQRELVPALRAAIAGIADADLRRPERPGKWSIAQVIQHLADSEMIYGYRYRMAIGQDGAPLAAYDQDAWAANLRYDDTDVEAALGELAAMRSANLRLLAGLTPDEWQRAGLHAERGRETVRQIFILLAGHDLLHRRQIERIKTALGIRSLPPRQPVAPLSQILDELAADREDRY